MNKILIIDDDKQLSLSFRKILGQDGYDTHAAYTGIEGIAMVDLVKPDLVILDIRLPDMSGMEVFEAVHPKHPKLPVIIITAHGTTETAIQAMKNGAFDYIYKPFDVPDMLTLIEKGIEAGRCMSSPVDVNPEEELFTQREAIVGNSPQMLTIYKEIGRVASTDATVLIRGESGTGKELAARAVYHYSSRSEKPFMVINCVAIPETLLESELFGYEKGAFTGASHRRVGKIEQARGGTVFLDEIGDMPMNIQAKFLRLLQENSIERLGGRDVVPVDVRIIAATNRDLEKAVADGTFREDLYYRLQVVTITLPPLRERKGDIAILSNYILTRISSEMGTSNPGISLEAMNKLNSYEWPGNIRELSNVLKKAMIFNRGVQIEADDLTINDFIGAALGGESNNFISNPTSDDKNDAVRQWIRQCLLSEKDDKVFDSCLDYVAELLIIESLNITGGNRSKASKLLGISRPTFHSKIEKYQIKIGSSIDKQ